MTPLATEWWFRPVISAARVGEQLEGGSLDWPAKGAAGAKTHVVCQDQQNVWRASGRLDTLGEVRCRVLDRAAHLTLERWLGLGQDLLRLLRLHRWCSRRHPRRRNEGSG